MMNAKFLLRALIVTISLAALAAPVIAERTFYWSMETDKADVVPAGSDDSPFYYPPKLTKITDAQAHEGKHALDVSGKWRAATFDNPTNEDCWANPKQGAIRFWWKYTGKPSAGMLFQLTGKSSIKALDTNDGLGVKIKSDKELTLGYGWKGSTESTIIRFHPAKAFEPDHWYQVTAKWNTEIAPHLSLQVDDAKPATGGAKPGETGCKTWHQILIGNDTTNAPEGLFIDDFEIWNDAAMTGPATKPTTREAMKSPTKSE